MLSNIVSFSLFKLYLYAERLVYSIYSGNWQDWKNTQEKCVMEINIYVICVMRISHLLLCSSTDNNSRVFPKKFGIFL